MASISETEANSSRMSTVSIEERIPEKEEANKERNGNPISRRSYLVNPFLLLKEIQKGQLETTVSSKASDGQDIEVLVVKNCNIEMPLNTHSGLITRKNDSYTIGDIHLVLVTPKEEYSYSFVMSRKGRKYLNVLERNKVINALLSGEGGKASSVSSEVATVGSTTTLGTSYHFERSLSLKEPASTTIPLDLPLQRHLAFQHDIKVPVCIPKDSLWISKNPDDGFGDGDEDSDDDEMLYSLKMGTSAMTTAINESSKNGDVAGTSVDNKESNVATTVITPSDIDGNTLLKAVLKREKSIASRYNVVCSFGCDFERILLKCEEVDHALHNGHSGRKYCHLPPSIHQAQIAQKLRRNVQWASEQERRARLKRSATTSFSRRKTAQIQALNLCVMDICIAQNTLPIILVPSGPTALINRNNAIDMLQNGKFIDPQKATKITSVAEDRKALQSFGAVTIEHFFKGKNRKFQIIESRYASRFQAKEWNSVVAVLIQGGRWQFHGWPFANFTDLFLSVMGCMFLYDTDALVPEVNNWCVKIFRISRSHRYNDAAICKEFWDVLEQFLLSPRARHPNVELKLIAT